MLQLTFKILYHSQFSNILLQLSSINYPKKLLDSEVQLPVEINALLSLSRTLFLSADLSGLVLSQTFSIAMQEK